jgi:hypothetical protein
MPRTSNVATGIVGRRIEPKTRQPVKVMDERDHYFICPDCGQAVDKRDLGEVLHHADEEHARLLTHS